MATSQAEVSHNIRHTVREMVEQGNSNQEIYQHIQDQYGKGQIGVPLTGWNVPLSYGIPYIMLVITGFVVLWWGSNWVELGAKNLQEEEEKDPRTGDELDERLENLREKIPDNPTRD